MDVWYVENQSFTLDLWILCKTVGKVIRREGINSAEAATMTPFRGNDPSHDK
jgi:lipopolysaccharide/colanic/teichoic acid biosynthesis glycosyltransferase